MMRLLVISPPLVIESYRVRWKRFANSSGFAVAVRALVPQRRPAKGYGEAFFIETKPEVDAQFELQCVRTTSENNSRYFIRNFHRALNDFSPDVIFCVHHEGVWQLLQTIFTRKLFFPSTKLVYFSMTAFPRIPPMRNRRPKEWLKRIYFWTQWWLIRHGTDGALCHYDRIENQMRSEGYKKPILQQTQYGVDPEQFRPDPVQGARMRAQYGLQGTVIGFCGRFVPAKGLREIMDAFSKLKGDCSLLLVGDGELRPEIEAWIAQKALQERVRITGYIPHTEVQACFQAMDIFVLGSKETPTYIDTFPLVVAQAMATGVPVVGSISGAIPYQLGGKGLLFPEGDAETLRQHLQRLLDDPERRKQMGDTLRERASANFCVDAMNERFMAFLRQEIGVKELL